MKDDGEGEGATEIDRAGHPGDPPVGLDEEDSVPGDVKLRGV